MYLCTQLQVMVVQRVFVLLFSISRQVNALTIYAFEDFRHL